MSLLSNGLQDLTLVRVSKPSLYFAFVSKSPPTSSGQARSKYDQLR